LQTLDDGHGRVGRAWILEESLRDPFARQYTRDCGPVRKKKMAFKILLFSQKEKRWDNNNKKKSRARRFCKEF
jgi:hypothetical protein